MRWLAAASIALALGTAPAAAAPVDPNARYKELVAAYAAGDRARAVAGIGTLDGDALRGGVDSLRGDPRLLVAALMMHTDRRLLEGRATDAPETTPGCASAHTDPAWRTTQHLLMQADGVDFVRRWFVAAALQDQWDGCFEDAVSWIDAAARWFANDPEVLLTRAALYETFAELPSPLPRPFGNVGPSARKTILVAVGQTNAALHEARRSLEHLLATGTPDRPLDESIADVARVRLGHLWWRLGKPDDARRALEPVASGPGDDDVRHLAHLFLARVHQDGGRDGDALRSLRAAVALQPTSQAAALGLADALQIAGETESAREAVEAALALAGRRPDPQSFWEYRFGFSRRGAERLEALREEAAR